MSPKTKLCGPVLSGRAAACGGVALQAVIAGGTEAVAVFSRPEPTRGKA